jgi:HEAT repeat protein
VPRLLVSAVGAAAVPVLVGLLDDADDEVAMNAATALGSLRDPAIAAPLQAIVDDPSRPSLLRGVAASALGMSGSSAAYDVLAPLLGSHDPSLVAGAIDGLAELGDPRAAPLIQALLAAGRLDERTARGARLALISLRTRR